MSVSVSTKDNSFLLGVYFFNNGYDQNYLIFQALYKTLSQYSLNSFEVLHRNQQVYFHK